MNKVLAYIIIILATVLFGIFIYYDEGLRFFLLLICFVIIAIFSILLFYWALATVTGVI